ncbi:IucA/IucC family protein [Streptomyces sp. BI20]|uniref:IucA/IucC family protein n=1 Tax=Streptomyces sp. BI20 TaxID=3403460 RepID=UPI003C71596B
MESVDLTASRRSDDTGDRHASGPARPRAPRPSTPAAADAPPPAADLAARADALAAVPLLNCLAQELGDPVPDPPAGHREFRLRGTGARLRVRAGRRPAAPELVTPAGPRALDHGDLVAVATRELAAHTGVDNDELPAEIADSREVVAEVLRARARTAAPADPYLRSEQALVMGHPYHPAPKTRGGGPAARWLPYAPEAHAAFPLHVLAVRADEVTGEGGAPAEAALVELVDRLDGPTRVPDGYALLPAHPWQLALVADRPELAGAFADGRLIRLGVTSRPAHPTASLRTLYVPGPDAGRDPALRTGDAFVKFSLDVRITNDIRRLWRHDLAGLRATDAAVVAAFEELREHTGSPACWLSDLGYRTARFAFEELAVLVRSGLGGHLLPGATPLLAAALAEGHEGGPIAALARPGADPLAWWRAYLRQVVPPLLEVFDRHGLVLEAHLQNTLIAVDAEGTPVQALFRDAEGVKRLPETGREAGWERLVYCLVVNHLSEIAGAVAEVRPEVAGELWPLAREELTACDARRPMPEIKELLTARTLPGKTNLLLRWTRADGAASRYLPLPNPLAG